MPIFELLQKFNGVRVHDDIKQGRRRYKLTKLPRYLVLCMKRFNKNNFFLEKNPTIVNFPVKNLELRDVIPVPTGTDPSTPLWHAITPNASPNAQKQRSLITWPCVRPLKNMYPCRGTYIPVGSFLSKSWLFHAAVAALYCTVLSMRTVLALVRPLCQGFTNSYS